MNAFEVFGKLVLDTTSFMNGLASAQNAISLGIRAIRQIGTAIGDFAAQSVSTGQEFDKSMSQVYATMGVKAKEMVEYNGETVSSMEALRDFAQEMGRTTAFSATQSAEALNYMALAGYDAATSMQMLPNVMNLAAAGGMDLARASDMVTDTQTAFGISLERTAQMVNEMAKASSTGNTSVEQLGDAFLVVGGLTQELNGGMVTLSDGTTQTVDNVQELEIALTAMANAGIKGGEAGTHMRNMLLKLASPSAEGTKQLLKMGVSVFDSAGKMRSLADIMGDLNGELSTMTQKEKIQAISDLFNARDIASAEALLNAVGEDWNSIGESILNAKDAATAMAGTQLDNLAGDITLFKSALEGAKISLSDVLSPTLREFVQFGTDGISKLTAAFTGNGLTGAMNSFGGILADGISMITEKLPMITEAGIALVSALGDGLRENLPAIMAAINTISTMTITSMIESFPDFINGGVTIIENIIVGITTSLPNIAKTLTHALGAIATSFGGMIPELGDIGYQLISTLLAVIQQNLPQLTKIAILIIDQISTGINDLLSGVGASRIGGMLVNGIFADFAKTIVLALPKIIDGVVLVIDGVIDFISNNTENFVSSIEQAFYIIVGVIPKLIPVIVELLSQTAPQLITSIITVATQIFTMLVSSLSEFLPKIITAVLEIIPLLIGAIPTIVTAIVEILPQSTDMIVQALIGALPMLIDCAILIVATLAEQLPTIIESLALIFPPLFESLGKTILEILPMLFTVIGDIIYALVEYFPTAKKKIVELNYKIGQSIIDKFKDFIPKLVDAGKNMVQGLWEGIQNAKDWIISKIHDWSDTLWDTFTDFFGIHSPSTLFAWAGENMAFGLGDGFEDAMSDVADDMANVVPTSFDVNTNSIKPVANGTSIVINIQNVNGTSREDAIAFGGELSSVIANRIFREKAAII